MSIPVIQAKQLTQKSGNTYLWKDIDIDVYPGQHWIIFGNNGSGKTTLLNILAGFQKPTSGELMYLGNQYSETTVAQIRQKIGYVSSSFFDKCFTHETALEIILSGICGELSVPFETTANDVRKAKHIMQQFALLDKIDFPYDLLSKGQRQCVLIARALMSRPDILILDEPTSGLDILSRSKILKTIEHLCATTSLTIIFVTHHADEVSLMFENCILLREGKIYCQGPTEYIFTERVLSEYFNAPLKTCWEHEHAFIQIETQVLDLEKYL